MHEGVVKADGSHQHVASASDNTVKAAGEVPPLTGYHRFPPTPDLDL